MRYYFVSAPGAGNDSVVQPVRARNPRDARIKFWVFCHKFNVAVLVNLTEAREVSEFEWHQLTKEINGG